MIYGKQGEPLHQRTVVNSRDSGINNHYDGNGLLYGGTFGSSINKAVFEKDFPSLGTEERQGVSEIARVSSPSFSSVSQSLPIHNSTLIDGEGWTSALAEVPSVNGSSGTGSLPASLIDSTSGSGSPSVTAGLNMAEALTQAPPRTHTIPRLSVKTQKCEELAIKQSRQLIPVTPSMPKGSVHNSVDKSKAKPAVRTSDMNITIEWTVTIFFDIMVISLPTVIMSSLTCQRHLGSFWFSNQDGRMGSHLLLINMLLVQQQI